MRRFNVMVFVGVVLMVSTAKAEQRVCGDGPVIVKAAVGQAVELVLENGVGDLVRSGDPSTLKVEHTTGHLFLTPLGTDPAEVTVIDTQGKSRLIRCILDQPVDRKIVIGDCADPEGASKEQDAVMSFMRDLIRGRVPAGATEQKTDEVMFDDGKVRMRAVLICQLPKLLGYAMVVENLTAGPVGIPVQQMSFPGLLAVSSMKDVLLRGERGDLYMVVGR